MHVLLSSLSEHVFWSPQGLACQDGHDLHQGWYFWDAAGLIGGGPYVTERFAVEAMNKYAEEC